MSNVLNNSTDLVNFSIDKRVVETKNIQVCVRNADPMQNTEINTLHIMNTIVA